MRDIPVCHTDEQAQQHGQGRDVQHEGGALAIPQEGGEEKRGGVTAPYGSRRISALQGSATCGLPVRACAVVIVCTLREIYIQSSHNLHCNLTWWQQLSSQSPK